MLGVVLLVLHFGKLGKQTKELKGGARLFMYSLACAKMGVQVAFFSKLPKSYFSKMGFKVGVLDFYW